VTDVVVVVVAQKVGTGRPTTATAPKVERSGTMPALLRVASIVHKPPKAPWGNSYRPTL